MKLITLQSIYSGFQTGVDTGAIIAADLLGFRTGGFAPQGWMTETGPNEEWIKSMNGVECTKPGYLARTEMNVRTTDATVIISHEPRLTGGSYETSRIAESLDKPWKQIRLKKDLVPIYVEGSLGLVEWLNMIECRRVNIAGPRESKCLGIEDRVCRWLMMELG